MENEFDKSLEQLGEERAKRVYYLRKSVLKLSRAKFAEKHKIPSGSLQNWEDVRYGGLTEHGARKLIKAFKAEGIDCDINWLLYGRGDEPVIQTLGGNLTLPDSSNYSLTEKNTPDEIALAEELKTFYRFHQNAVDTIIADDGLAPFFQAGYHVAGEKLFHQDIARAIGMACIIQTQDGKLLVRQLEKAEQAGCYNLSCTNPKSRLTNLENIKLFSAAPIIWIRKPRIN